MKHLLFFVALMTTLVVCGQTTKQSAQRKRATTSVTKRQTNVRQRTQQNRQAIVYKDVVYTIQGKTTGYADGEWVKLCTPSPEGLLAYDSAQIKNGTFSFSGKTKEIPHMQYLTLGSGMQKNITELFLEKGTINVSLEAGKKKDRVTGTTHNNIYTPYRDSLNDTYTKLFACITEQMKLSNSKEDRESYKAGADMLRQKIVDLSYDYANKNMDNWVGVYLFAEYYKRFTAQQNKTLLPKLTKKYGRLPITGIIRKYVNAQK